VRGGGGGGGGVKMQRASERARSLQRPTNHQYNIYATHLLTLLTLLTLLAYITYSTYNIYICIYRCICMYASSILPHRQGTDGL